MKLMKRAAIQIAVLAGILLLVCVVCRMTMRNAYVARVPVHGTNIQAEEIRVSMDTPDIVEPGSPVIRNGWMRMTVRPRHRGDTYVDLNDGKGNDVAMLHFRVSRFGTVYDSATGGFTGDSIVLVAFTVFCLMVAAIMFGVFRRSRGPAFYAYDTIYAAGFSLFALVTGVVMLVVTLRHLLQPQHFSMMSTYRAISSASWHFMMITAPLLLAFAAAMAVSNIALLRHERFRPQNVLGIGIAVVLVLGEALAFFMFTRNFSGSEWRGRVLDTAHNVYATVFAYFECMLIGAVVCGLKAARHVPEANADYILILGCKFRKDGTLTPLLRGRVDKAIEFWKREKQATGREAVLVPSGGQGSDEVMPEAEAMRNYLLTQDVPERCVMVEDKSRNTYQNMEFSKALIEKSKPDGRVVYVTTNYHVFRSGVWAGLAGLPAEGLGSRTKWWYWPNAFMRECAGLMLNRVPQELALLVVMIGFFALLSMALG